MKGLLVDLLLNYPTELNSERRPALLALLTDRHVEPNCLSPAGWRLVLQSIAPDEAAPDDAELERLAEALETDELAIALLREAPVFCRRRSGCSRGFGAGCCSPGSGAATPALCPLWRRRQVSTAARGPWMTPSARLDGAEGSLVAAYLPRPASTLAGEADAADPVTRTVAAHYESWPYPAWTRITRCKPQRLPDVVRALDPGVSRTSG